MSKSFLLAMAASLALFANAAQATPIETLTISGNLGFGFDGAGLFSPVNHNFTAADFASIQLMFDPTALTGDTCGASPNNSCNWNFGPSGLTEVVTIDGISKTFVGLGGGIQYCSCGGFDQIHLNTSNVQIGADFVLAAPIFKNQLATIFPVNVNDPLILVDFNSIAVLAADFGTSGLGPIQNVSLGLNLLVLSASYAPNGTGPGNTTHVPEPSSIALFGAGLASLGLLAMARRKKNRRFH